MLDTAPMQRSFGQARVTLSGGRLVALHQAGSAKAMLRLRGTPEVVFLNTSGGMTDGDRLELSFGVTQGAATATTQTAERAYRASPGGIPARVRVSLSAGPGARLNWLPQETIMFDDARLDRLTSVDLAPDAAFLGLETIILGRAAMGETVRRLGLTDRRVIQRNGRLLLSDPLRLTDAALARAGHALLGGARAMAVLVLVQDGAADALVPIRAALDEPGVTAAASALDGRLVVRAVAADGWPLRRQMIRLIEILRPGALPRVWQI
ncbi:MAG: urease accessory protein UreD [Paracoccus sp. (in: a-proteobacteria)]|uniref:urease accessory protein UreD n=1 Tax=Paracoccus sp. TaxID=267 RepID=UPI0026DEFCDB|nr:urease accessory protein UreD [Paracoccus sp. (in: a-proteobacteria)]MDO5632636.1 urease accessory protein UreD [Paracoccus sp. (in: a-proteobacteria)]